MGVVCEGLEALVVARGVGWVLHTNFSCRWRRQQEVQGAGLRNGGCC